MGDFLEPGIETMNKMKGDMLKTVSPLGHILTNLSF